MAEPRPEPRQSDFRICSDHLLPSELKFTTIHKHELKCSREIRQSVFLWFTVISKIQNCNNVGRHRLWPGERIVQVNSYRCIHFNCLDRNLSTSNISFQRAGNPGTVNNACWGHAVHPNWSGRIPWCPCRNPWLLQNMEML